MRRSQKVGTKYDPQVDAALDKNQNDLVDELITPHSTKLNEMLGCSHKIVASYPAHTDPQMPIRGQGAVVWNNSYDFQAHGPTYLDPIPDPGLGGGR
jgi:hypothetical protein